MLLLVAIGLFELAQASPPVILRPPVSQHIEEGSFVRFSISSPPIPSVSYQWFQNGKVIPGANSANYDLYNITQTNRGGFQVRLKTGNAATWSQVVELEVTPQTFRPGMIDTSFSVDSLNGKQVNTITPMPNGTIYLGGSFDQIDGHLRANIARVFSDGSIDPSFNATVTIPGPDTDPEVLAIAVDSQNRIIVGGRFTYCNGQPRENIARLNPDGSLDSPFNPGANGQINTLLFDQEDRLIIGGTFTTFGDASVSRLVRLHSNDSLDTNFTQQQNFDSSVEEVIQNGDQFYICGGFTERIVRLHTSGARDSNFESYTPRFPVTDVAVLPDGDIIACGRFSGGIIKLDSTGNRVPNFEPSPNNFIYDLNTTTDGKILLAGDFTRLDGLSIRSLARLFTNGDLDDSFHPPSLDGAVHSLQMVEGELLIGGEFKHPHNHVMRVQPSPPIPPQMAPVIVTQPRSRVVWPGSMVTLGVGLEESFGATYQWFDDNGQIPNADSPTLQLLNFSSEQVGNYYVIVTRNGISTRSESAKLSLALATGLAPRAHFMGDSQLLNSAGITRSTISVPTSFQIAQVRPHLKIDHPKINDLTITLSAPDGTEVKLYDRNGRRGSNLRTTFDSSAPAKLNDGAAPWLGTWKPDESLNSFQNRLSQGTWTLEIQDPSSSVNGGSLEEFRLELIAHDPEVDFTNWLHPSPTLEHLHLDQDHLYFTHYRWRNAPNLTYQYQALQGNTWVQFSPTLLYQENLENNQDVLEWCVPYSNTSKIIRLKVTSK